MQKALAARQWIARQQSGDVNVPPPPTVNPTVVVFAPAGAAGPVALVDIARARSGNGSNEAVVVERAGESVRVRHGLRDVIGVDDRDRPTRVEAQCLLGTLGVGDGAFFLVSVTDSEEMIRRNVLGAGSVRSVKRVVFTPLDPQASFVLDGARPGATEPSAASKILAQLRSDLEDGGFYYSPDGFDLTATLQRQARQRTTQSRFDGSAGVHSRASDARFYWNAQLLQPFTAAAVDEAWLAPVMRGYVGCAEGRMCEGRLASATILLSRRACQHAGTRYHTRGSNDDGHAANFVESELVMVVVRMPGQQQPGGEPQLQGPWRASYVQTRGSVPLFWSQSGMQYRPKPVLHRTPAQNVAVLRKHMATQAAYYGEPLAVLSLLNGHADEAELATAYQQSLATMTREGVPGAPPPPRACFLPFDFHKQIKTSGTGGLQPMYAYTEQHVTPAMQRLGGQGPSAYWVAPRPDQPPTTEQAGVVRTNCLDCLDRTNVVQHCLARLALARMLEQARKEMNAMAGGIAAGSWESECVRVADGVQKLFQ
ncbi:SacI homology domain-containing protein, partial [Pavlovales sp. CCMP2436]